MRFARILGALLVAAIVTVSGQRLAWGQDTDQQGQTAETFTLLPGGRATITFQAFCLNFAQSFPDGLQAPEGLAQDQVRAGLAYVLEQGLTDDQEQAEQIQNAIWRLTGATDSPRGNDTAEMIVNNATAPPQPPEGATSFIDAAQANQVTVTVTDWQPLGEQIPIGQIQDHFYGRGTMVVENTSQQELTLYMPIGTEFAPTEEGSQRMAGYAIDIQVQNPATPTPTATPTPEPTPMPEPTPTPRPPAELPEASEYPGNPLLLLLAVTLGLLGLGAYALRRV